MKADAAGRDIVGQVAINTTITDVNEFLDHIVSSTNMKCLTPPSALGGNCGFLAANLYAKSVFAEDALVNLSVEKAADGKLSGYIRIRQEISPGPHILLVQIATPL
jgi:coatomer subunit beta